MKLLARPNRAPHTPTASLTADTTASAARLSWVVAAYDHEPCRREVLFQAPRRRLAYGGACWCSSSSIEKTRTRSRTSFPASPGLRGAQRHSRSRCAHLIPKVRHV